ncbi:MAG TPA: NAD-dependent epimerase/dehydratase family protein [Sporichthyaceae bacterium]|jgi:nucleoside-diphosphate-sugar epimerase/phosphohistidine swiveling domain-containing protein
MTNRVENPRTILVTGASGVFGREITERLLRRGHRVVGLSRRLPANPCVGADYVAADIRDLDALTRAIAGADVVAHCAWAVEALFGDPAEREINVGGTQNVLTAMERTGVRRIVFASSTTAYGPKPDDRSRLLESTPLAPHPEATYAVHKAEVEALLESADVDAVSIRSPVVVGRRIDNRVRNLLAGPVIAVAKGRDISWQVVHADDVGRFFAVACERGPAGPVNLAAPEIVSVEQVAAAFGKRIVRIPEARLEKGIAALYKRKMLPVNVGDFRFVLYQPLLDTTRQREEFGFECAWSGPDALEDTRLSLVGVLGVGDKALTMPWKRPFRPGRIPSDTPALDGAALEPGAKPDHVGEFDSPVDPRFATFVATNFSEALPGPATPLSLTAVAPAFAQAGVAAVQFIGLKGVARTEAHARMFSIQGHRVYMNVATGAAIGELSPGWDAESFAAQYLGRHLAELPPLNFADLPMDKVTTLRGKAKAGGGMGVRLGGLLVGYRKDIDEMLRQIARLERLAGDPSGLSDAALESMFNLGYDLQCHGWRLAGLGAILSGAGTNTAEQLAGRTGVVEQVGEGLTSAEALSGVRRLAESAAAEPAVLAILTAGGSDQLGRIEAVSPSFAAAVRTALRTFGHRGPAECELASSVFADDPDLVLRTVGKAASAAGPRRPPPVEAVRVPRRAKPAVALARWATAERERDRDALVRVIGVMRAIAREQGRRLAAAGVLADPADVFYLTYDELFAPDPDARPVVTRRRAERERLAAVRLPIAFVAPWEPEPAVSTLAVGDRLTGVAAAGGKARGRVRIVTPDTADELEPGEVFVAQVTDVGYTPLFGHAAAVITDIGGTLSHAAVVAREFGIPAVCDTANATVRLVDGMEVEVDGTAGTVVVLSAP